MRKNDAGSASFEDKRNDSGSASTEDKQNDSGNASIEDKHQCEEVVIEITDPTPECCIYKVHKKLRNINREAYTPQLISIGPYHCKNNELAKMQKQKKRYQEDFLNRISTKRFEKFKKFVNEEEQHIRNCYAEPISEGLCPDFINMILDDAVFIIELFLRNHLDDRTDFLLNKPWLRNAIELDLQLLENQLPYFVLKKLYVLAVGSSIEEVFPSFINVYGKFFNYVVSDEVVKSNERNFKHFVDIRRYLLLAEAQIPPNEESLGGKIKKSGGKIEDLPSAVKLDESGVKLKLNKESKSLLDIKFKKRITSFIPCCTGEELQIPRIRIEDGTECLIRNLMALEQCHYPLATHICNYIDLMDSLINTRKDVDLLVEKGIISNCVGDHDSIKVMFNKLCLEIIPRNSCYEETINKLKDHHKKWWNRTKATLISVYFSNLWRGTGTVAAVVLLLLTLLQTMQRFFPEWFSRSKY